MRTKVLLAAVVVCAFGTQALADGMIIIHPWPRPMPQPQEMSTVLEVKYHKVTVAITDQSAETSIDQVFHNPVGAQLEGTYIFPLADDVAVNRFTMYMGGKEVVGELLDKDAARKTYEDIVRKMKDPALLEYMGTRMYKARVFPIPANGDVRVTLKYSQLVPVDEGVAFYRYPLNTEKFSAKPLENVTIGVTLESKVPLKNIYSPSHKVSVIPKGDHAASISYEDKNVKPSTDFLLYYAFQKKDFGLNLLTHRPSEGEPGFFLALVSPKQDTDPNAVVPKDVVFAIDTSGSMSEGDKITQAKKALVYCLKHLRPNDRYNLVPFSGEPEPYHDKLVEASPMNVDADVKRIGTIEAAGGTNINDTLLLALSQADKTDADRPFIVVFLTDGKPTLGKTTEIKDIIANVQKANATKARVFVFGVGDDVNTMLLDSLATQNHGATTYVAQNEDIEVKVSSFYNKIAFPVLSDLAVEWGVKVTDVYPRELPDLFLGSQLVVLGRYEETGDKAVTLSGKRSGKVWKDSYDATFPRTNEKNEFLPRLWAVRKVGYLLEQIRLHGESKEVKDEVVRLSKRYGIMTPYTSFLVMEDIKAGDRPGASGQPPVPMGLREGLSLNAPRAADAGRGFGEQSGGGAVDASKAIGGYKHETTIDGSRGDDGLRDREGRETIKRIADKTFYRAGEKWVDQAYDGKSPTIKVKYLGDEYLALVSKSPALGKFFALGKQVIVLFDGKAYEVTE